MRPSRIGDAGAVELAKEVSINSTVTCVCMSWQDEHALHSHSSFALTRGRFDAIMQLALPQGSMSAAARDILNHAWYGHSIVWI